MIKACRHIAAAVVLASTLSAADAVAAELAAIKSKGVITSLTTANDRPNAFLDLDGKPTGYEIEFCNYIAQKLGVKLDLGVIAWPGILPSLSAGRADIICSAVNYTPARAKLYDFSVPYSRTNIVAIVPTTSTATGPTDTAGRVVGGTTGADGEDVIRAIGGYKDIRIYSGNSDLFADFAAGRLDMVITGDIQGGTLIKNRPGIGKIVGQAYKTNFVAIPMTLGSPELKAALDDIVKSARQDGTLDGLADKYFGLKNFTASLPPIGQAPEIK